MNMLLSIETTRYVPMCIPGRTDSDPGTWCVYDRGARRSEPARDQVAAVSRARELNGARV